jgi:hypothetical protein
MATESQSGYVLKEFGTRIWIGRADHDVDRGKVAGRHSSTC